MIFPHFDHIFPNDLPSKPKTFFFLNFPSLDLLFVHFNSPILLVAVWLIVENKLFTPLFVYLVRSYMILGMFFQQKLKLQLYAVTLRSVWHLRLSIRLFVFCSALDYTLVYILSVCTK